VNKLGSIQRLRALAALSVALFHAGQWSDLDFGVGAAGVDMFFVISGFVLWTATESRPVTPARFLAARAARVVPLYWIVNLAVAALVLWRPRAMTMVHMAPGHILLSMLFIPHQDPWGNPFPLLSSGWTLNYEVFFYLAFALALAGPPARRLQVLSCILVAVAVGGFGYPDLYQMLANPMLLEFLIGVGLARLWDKGDLGRLDPRWGWAAEGLGALMLVGQQVGGVRSDLWRPVLWAPPVALIVAGALTLEAAGPLRTGWFGRALEHLGDASYSLYLCQLPVVSVVRWLTPGLSPWIRAPLGLVLSVVAGLACYRLVERPISRALPRLGLALGGRRRAWALHRHGRGLGPPEQEALAAVDADLA
jgi:exopolysaccharide production protein ExoZ